MEKKYYLNKLLDARVNQGMEALDFQEKLIKIRGRLGEKTLGQVSFACQEKGARFGLYIESLKGLVQPEQEWYDGQDEYTCTYHLKADGLKHGYTYEDVWKVYHVGGVSRIFFLIYLSKDLDISVVTSQEPEDIWDVKRPFRMHIHPQKRTFSLEEPIVMNITNEGTNSEHVMIECEVDGVEPRSVEFFIKDTWSQEWYFKESVFRHWIEKLRFKEKAFIDIPFLFLTSEGTRKWTIRISRHANYDTRLKTVSEEEYKSWRMECLRVYIHHITYKNRHVKTKYIWDQMKACLNYNQEDFMFRLFYLWQLILSGQAKEANEEIQFIQNYATSYENHEHWSFFLILVQVVKKYRMNFRRYSQENEGSHWIVDLWKIDKMNSSRMRYINYKKLYDRGLKCSLLIAKTASLLNLLPILEGGQDRFYVVVLHWAINHECLRKEWLTKLAKNYYALEQNPYMTSRLADRLYKLLPHKGFLKMFCHLAVREGRQDEETYNYMEEALRRQYYIKDLEISYIKVAYANQKAILIERLRGFQEIEELGIEHRLYVYISIAKNYQAQELLYKRFRESMLESLASVHLDRDAYNQQLRLAHLIFGDLKEERFDLLMNLACADVIGVDVATEELEPLVSDCLETIFTAPWQEQVKKNYLYHMSEVFTFERLILCAPFYRDSLEAFFMHNYKSFSKDQAFFLSQKAYGMLLSKQTIEEEFLEDLLLGRDLEDIYRKLQETSLMKSIDMSILAKEVTRRFLWDDVDGEWNMVHNILKILPDSEKWKTMVAQKEETVFLTGIYRIEYLAKKNQRVYLNYRIESDEQYTRVELTPVGFGWLNYGLKLYYGEMLQYYLVLENEGRQEIVQSEQEIYLPRMDIYMDDSAFGLDAMEVCLELEDDTAYESYRNDYNQSMEKWSLIERF